MEWGKQLRLHQQNFKDASYQNSNYSLVYNNPNKNVRADIDKSIKTKVVTFDTAPGAILGSGLSLLVVGPTSPDVAGSGYSSAPSVSVSNAPEGGTNATITSSISGGGAVSSLTITNAGSGYTSVPTITINAPSGSGTQATAVALMGLVGTISVDYGGKGYTSAPTITVSGSGALTAVLDDKSVDSVSVTTASTGYTSVPTLSIAAPTTTKFKEDLIEPLIVDRLSDVFLDSFTTFNCKANTSSDNSTFILDVDEFNIHSNSNNSKIAFNKCIIPNISTAATGTTVHKGKKLNYMCSINPCRLNSITTNLTILDGTTILAPDGGRYIGEFVIKPQAIKL